MSAAPTPAAHTLAAATLLDRLYSVAKQQHDWSPLPPPAATLCPCPCRDVCNSGGGVEEKMAKLGALMDESHASCRDLYECSSPELEELVKVSPCWEWPMKSKSR